MQEGGGGGGEEREKSGRAMEEDESLFLPYFLHGLSRRGSRFTGLIESGSEFNVGIINGPRN